MPLYQYKARDPKGQIVTATMEADSEQAVRNRLREKNYIVTQVGVKGKSLNAGDMMASFQKVKPKSLTVFSRQFATMISAGLSLVRALDILERQSDDKKLKEVVGDVRRRVEEGSALADAFEAHPTVFSSLYINLTRAGEVGGVLDETMHRVAEFMEKDQTLRAKVKSAMTYPTVIFFFAIAIVVFLLVFALPSFASMFESVGSDLPLMTKVVIMISDTLRNYWLIWIVVIVVLIVAFKQYTKTPKGLYNWHKLMLSLPVFGMLNRKVTVSRFSRTLGTLLSSGVPVMQALEVTGKASGNSVVEKAVDSVRVSIREGESISVPMEASGIFPPMVTQMIAVGEETGSLDAMLKKISDFYDMEVEATLDSLTSLIEPLLMAFMGIMVGFIVIAMYLPLFTIINEL
jgi:type IV pilus assembly protein PilC